MVALNAGASNGVLKDEPAAAANGTGSKGASSTYKISEVPLKTPKQLRVACIGAGVSGILTAIKFREAFGSTVEVTLWEKNADLGGTWLENRYPGVACDVPGHAYTYTFEPNPDYSTYYVGAEEIWRYVNAVADKYKVKPQMRFLHRLTGAIWQAEEGVWDLTFEVTNAETGATSTLAQKAEVVINAGGNLNKWKWPAIEGLDSFKGKLLHSARWDDSYDMNGKSIGVIGSGSSAIQIIPKLQPILKDLTAFIRSPTWIAPSQGFVDPKEEGPTNFVYTAEEKKFFRENPEEFLKYRKKIEHDMNGVFDVMVKDGAIQKDAFVSFAEKMRERLGYDEALSNLLIPKWGVGCRRLTPGKGFLEALIKPNVTVVSSEIARVVPEGVETADGKVHPMDALVCATGFDTTFKPRFELRGTSGVDLRDAWADTNNVDAYLGVAISDYPNYFTYLGPNNPISNGTLIPVLEKQCEYMTKLVRKIQTESVKSLMPSLQAVKELNVHHQTFMPRLVFSDGCRSWYKGGRADGKVIAIWPGSSIHYYDTISEVRWEDFVLTYDNPTNRYQYLGNGFSLREFEENRDLAWYLTIPDEVITVPEAATVTA